MAQSSVSENAVCISDSAYESFLASVRDRFSSVVGEGGVPLFTTDSIELFEAFMQALPEVDRPIHACNACRRFVENFGGLVTVSEDGLTVPVMWDDASTPDEYRAAVASMAKIVAKAKITGVFYSEDKAWGLPKTGEWTHVAVVPPKAMVFKHSINSAYQAAAEKKQDYITIVSALADFTLPVVKQAVQLLSVEALYRSEKCLGVAEWLAALHEARAAHKGSHRAANLTWLAVAKAPAGFCLPRTSMIGLCSLISLQVCLSTPSRSALPRK